ncbi:hypothetical protein Pcinc_032193 [Petrolisthes cinctipes]|uniref:Uncharacterized protein n=1 Tax=Petrolisthes cinctipes TaxID=88211 RepID=A0AAE1EUW5_PETCI|nr:hypothetical protein Pcinc_032193 [Petrolisthes cinctipes]
MEDMSHVFDKAQESESKRLQFFKEMLFATHKCLNISNDSSLPRIYEEFNHTVDNADYEKDLKWWSNNHGVNMPMNWPAFEEYTPDLHRISKKGVKGAVSGGGVGGGGGGDVTLTGIKGPPPPANHNNTTSTNAPPPSSKASDNNRISTISDPQDSQEASNPFDDEEEPQSQK